MRKIPKFIVVTEEVLKMKNLNSLQKLVFSNIANVELNGGTFKFNNEWISSYIHKSVRSVSGIISHLVRIGLITTRYEYHKGTNKIKQRVVQLSADAKRLFAKNGKNDLAETCVDNKQVSSLDTTLDKKNNNSINQRCDAFTKEVHSFKEFDYHHADFIDYWTEYNKSKTKMRFELERTWDTKRRLKTWTKNSDTNFGKKNPNQKEEFEKEWRRIANGQN